MRTKITLILLVCILVGCAKNVDIESVNLPLDPVTQTVLPKISKDIESLSAEDAVKVANIFSQGGLVTKSKSLKEVTSVVPIKDADGVVLMYAVNYNDGYVIVSATKKYYPVLVSADHGNYSGDSTETGHDVLMSEYAANIKSAISNVNGVKGNPWGIYEDLSSDLEATTKISNAYYELLAELSYEWQQEGYNVYRLNQKPENMSDELYADFCDVASDYNRSDHPYMQCSVILERNYQKRTSEIDPMLQTEWGQYGAYNDALNSDLPLGCTTVAIGQIMRYLEYPTNYNWSAMPNSLAEWETNSTLTDFLAQLRRRIGVTDSGAASIDLVRTAISLYYGYTSSNGYSLDIISHSLSSVASSLSQGVPVYMRGIDEEGDGHAWVCDGHYAYHYQTDYKLYVIPMWGNEITELICVDTVVTYPDNHVFYNFFHMNWGWDGSSNGYYFHDQVNTPNGNYTSNRKELIITRL